MSSAAAALQMMERRQQVLANNLANATTRGFKAETAFARMMGDAIAVTDTAIDLKQGSLTETHNPLDIAIDGDGFFVTKTAAGDRFVRDGSFRLDAERRLVDQHDNAVLGEEGPITLPLGMIEIDKTGLVKVNGKPLQRLRIETVPEGTALQHEGGTQFVPPATRQPLSPESRKIRQGFVDRHDRSTASLRRCTKNALNDRFGAWHRGQ
jgi:flagellar basal-body rod protein FlgF